MQYFIFGGSGFIGSHLIRAIAEEWPDAKIYNIDIEPDTHEGRATYIAGDVRQRIELPAEVEPQSSDVVVNLAAIHRTPGHPDSAYFETNIRGAENVTEFASRHNIGRMFFTSSIAPYGASEDKKDEHSTPMPTTPYGISKLTAEHIHREWQVAQAGRELTILRPGVVFGHAENGNFTRLYWGIRKHCFGYAGRKDTIKACIYVKDLVGFMLYKLDHHTPNSTETYNCCIEPSQTIEQIVDTMKQATGLTQWVPYIPLWILMPIAYVAAAIGSPMGICPARVRKLTTSTNIDGRKMRDSGYAMRYTLREAIEDWLRESEGRGLE